MVLSSVRKKRDSKDNETYGWWVVLPREHSATAAQLHDAVRQAPLHLCCKHDIGPGVGGRIKVVGMDYSNASLSGAQGCVTHTHPEAQPPQWTVQLDDIPGTIRLPLEHLKTVSS